MGDGAGDKKARQARITLRNVGGLLEVELAPLEIPPGEARPGDLVSVANRSGYEFLSGKDGALLARPDLRAGERKPSATRIDQVVAIHHRTGQGDYVIVESLATPRLARVQGALAGPEHLVRTLPGGRRRAYLLPPPGAGKTLIGHEIARRLGNRWLVLGHNTAIQEQWVKQWRTYHPASVGAGDTTDLTAPITALTYQAICDLDSLI